MYRDTNTHHQKRHLVQRERIVAWADARLLRLAIATQQSTIGYLIQQATSAGTVSAKPMFGEYGVYVAGKMIWPACDDQLLGKPTV